MTPEHYARSGHKKVRGWLESDDAQAILHLAKQQTVTGPCCEIGVHHGRLFTLLHLLTEGTSVAIDLFDSQHENLDGSGHGSREKLLRNIALFGDPSRVRIIAANSLTVTAQQIGPVRLFSVDGGHTAEVTYNDLSIALDATIDGGLVILDDYFNPYWPAVSEGACQFMRERPGLSPVLIGRNKFVFAKGDAPYVIDGERSTVFGKPVSVLRSNSLRSVVARSRLWRALRRR